ncbi:MAG: hypothetical protein DRJ52_10270 [Thermoprotei archaeon]|nr:MAG: hypothetical protein DRJ52_10270 [Thermoprotei archaeon]RLF00929.1 MAG: hypothetical protein DRJ63_00785 [Thermoprotei archaeon]HDI74398.1 hypothetical protein [Thermoprotei archaeon]
MRVTWKTNREVEWAIKVVPNKGVLLARVKLVHTRSGPMIVEKVLLRGKRGDYRLILEEWYTLSDYRKIISALKALVAMEEDRDALSDLEEVINLLISIKERIAERWSQ